MELVQYLKERAGRWFSFCGREGEGEAGPVTGGESRDSSAQEGGPGLFKGVFCNREVEQMFCWFCFKERRPGESQNGAGAGRGAAGPVSQERRQEKRVKWSRETAACLRMCSLDTLQSA